MTDNQKTVVLGVSGGIAAYKSCEVIRGLQKAGVRVKVVMTEHATEFVSPLTFRSLTHEPVAVGLFDDPSDPIHHISLAEEADVFLVAPATANIIAKMANGIADDLLSTSLLATTAPILVAPAMNVHMYEAPATINNLAVLAGRDVEFVEAGSGYLACGDVGRGRLADVEDIVARTLGLLDVRGDLAGKKVLITAGPTVEPIDPVRYVSNYSSGKTGYALAAAAARRGADVTVVSGPVSIAAPAGVKVVPVTTADQMLQEASEVFPGCDIAIFAAAVADMRPANPASEKLKKGKDSDALKAIELTENPDILSTLAHTKTSQIVVGFAAETCDVLDNAEKKMASKNADIIVANQVGDGKAFGTDGNEIWIVTPQGSEHIPFAPKAELADVILDKTLEI